MHIAEGIRPGQGDIFASVIAADAVNGVDFFQSVEKATGFVRICPRPLPGWTFPGNRASALKISCPCSSDRGSSPAPAAVPYLKKNVLRLTQ